MTQNQNQHNYVIRIPLSTSKLLNDKIKNYQIKIMSNSAHLKNHKVMELGIDLVSLYIEENPTELDLEMEKIINAVHETKTQYDLFQSNNYDEDEEKEDEKVYRISFKSGWNTNSRGIYLLPCEKDQQHLEYIAEHLSNCLADIDTNVSVRENYVPKLYIFEDPNDNTSFYEKKKKKVFWRRSHHDIMQVKEFHLIKLSTMKTVACFTKKSNCLDYENLNEQIK